jgi:hypothetical protein
MAHDIPVPRRASRAGTIGLVLLFLAAVIAYVAGEWLVDRHAQAVLGQVLRADVDQEIGIEVVAMDGWLFSRQRSGEALVVLGPELAVPLEFTLVGHPLTGATITVAGYDHLQRLLSELLQTAPEQIKEGRDNVEE